MLIWVKDMQFRNFGAESSAGWQGEISGGNAPAQGKMGGAEVWTILNRFGAGYKFCLLYTSPSPRD